MSSAVKGKVIDVKFQQLSKGPKGPSTCFKGPSEDFKRRQWALHRRQTPPKASKGPQLTSNGPQLASNGAKKASKGLWIFGPFEGFFVVTVLLCR